MATFSSKTLWSAGCASAVPLLAALVVIFFDPAWTSTALYAVFPINALLFGLFFAAGLQFTRERPRLSAMDSVLLFAVCCMAIPVIPWIIVSALSLLIVAAHTEAAVDVFLENAHWLGVDAGIPALFLGIGAKAILKIPISKLGLLRIAVVGAVVVRLLPSLSPGQVTSVGLDLARAAWYLPIGLMLLFEGQVKPESQTSTVTEETSPEESGALCPGSSPPASQKLTRVLFITAIAPLLLVLILGVILPAVQYAGYCPGWEGVTRCGFSKFMKINLSYMMLTLVPALLWAVFFTCVAIAVSKNPRPSN